MFNELPKTSSICLNDSLEDPNIVHLISDVHLLTLLSPFHPSCFLPIIETVELTLLACSIVTFLGELLKPEAYLWTQ